MLWPRCVFFNLRKHQRMISKKSVDAQLLVIYDQDNTGKEVIQKFMSSYHSEVAAA
jgi:hypothetical protein